MVIIFDLDDTLYDESQFIRSGFKAVAKYLAPLLNLNQENIVSDLEKECAQQRDLVFNRFLAKHKITSEQVIDHCVGIYRYNEPSLSLYPEALPCFERLENYPLYVLTDGNRIVQWNKFLALGLQPIMKKCVCTDEYGLYRNKPSSYCFEKICEWEKISPSQVVYVADNPYKDFIGIKPLGFRTVRVLTGANAKAWVFPRWDGDMKIMNLGALDVPMLKKLIRINNA